jgi:PadR family transcriptional regulator PadR
VEDKPSALVQGTLYMLILKTLALEPLHGYGIGVRLEQISRGAFQVNAGSLFPALRRLERDGLISGPSALARIDPRMLARIGPLHLFSLSHPA